MASQLHELLAVEGDLQTAYKQVIDNIKGLFTKKDAPEFYGYHREYKAINEAGQALAVADEHKEHDTTVPRELDRLREVSVRYFDAVLQKELANQEALAQVIIEGVPVTPEIPATFLLGLETKLAGIQSLVAAAPLLSPGKQWSHVTDKPDDIWVSPPDKVFRTQKTYVPQVLYAATPEHPAQVDKIEETKNVGEFIKTVWSGAISPQDKQQILARIDILIRAVKQARQRANTADVKTTQVGQKLFDYILKGQ